MESTQSTPSPAPPRWVILDRVALVCAEEDDAAGDQLVSASLPAPLGVARLSVPVHLHPDPAAPDQCPYILFADRDAGLLLNLAKGPLTGLELALRPQPASTLVLLRDFIPEVVPGEADERCTARSVVRIPDREDRGPRMASLKALGLLSLPGSGGAEYMVAELCVHSGVQYASLFCFRSGATAWTGHKLCRPDMPGRTSVYWGWDVDDVVAHDGNLWWISLKRGILSCNPLDEQPVLRLDEFPETVAEECQVQSGRSVEADMIVRVSRGRIRYVEFTRAMGEPSGARATMLSMWTLVTCKPDGLTWWKLRTVTMLDQIWQSDAYKTSNIPLDIPMLAAISPSDPDSIFLLLGQYLFVVDVAEGQLLDSIVVQPDTIPLPCPPNSWRNLIAWEIPVSITGELEYKNISQVSLLLQNEKMQLKRSLYAVKMREDTLNMLEERLLQHNAKQEDSTWEKIQIVLLCVLITGLTVLFQFWPWIVHDFV
ncbi:hypothetical protein BS78_08G074800 [Paspalum vaginatum]|nr:hypothetical protein BS78_08G074800 [Paspalum vaginatum]